LHDLNGWRVKKTELATRNIKLLSVLLQDKNLFLIYVKMHAGQQIIYI